MQRTDIKAAAYTGVRDVEPWMCVDDFKVRWLAEKQLTGVDPALCSLWLVSCDKGKPSPGADKLARELDDPSETLAAAGVRNGCWLQVRFREAITQGAPTTVVYSVLCIGMLTLAFRSWALPATLVCASCFKCGVCKAHGPG